MCSAAAPAACRTEASAEAAAPPTAPFRRDAPSSAEIWPRSSRDQTLTDVSRDQGSGRILAEVWPRSDRDLIEIRPRYDRDAAPFAFHVEPRRAADAIPSRRCRVPSHQRVRCHAISRNLVRSPPSRSAPVRAAPKYASSSLTLSRVQSSPPVHSQRCEQNQLPRSRSPKSPPASAAAAAGSGAVACSPASR